MEKVVYIVWRDPRDGVEQFAQRLRGELPEKLLALGARGVQVKWRMRR